MGCSVAAVLLYLPVSVSIYSPKTLKTNVMSYLSICNVIILLAV